MTILEGINAAFRFALEICALAALGYWGFQISDSPMEWLLGLGAPLAFALLWGAFIAPKAPMRMSDPARLLLEVMLFTVAAAALVAAGLIVLATIFAAAIAVNLLLMIVLDQRHRGGI